MTTWRTRLEPFTRPLFFTWSRISPGMTLTDRTSHGEIAEIGRFDPADLPDGTHRATWARVAEIYGGAERSVFW